MFDPAKGQAMAWLIPVARNPAIDHRRARPSETPGEAAKYVQGALPPRRRRVFAAGLVVTLSGAGPFAIFAPTDAAAATLTQGTVETLQKREDKGIR